MLLGTISPVVAQPHLMKPAALGATANSQDHIGSHPALLNQNRSNLQPGQFLPNQQMPYLPPQTSQNPNKSVPVSKQNFLPPTSNVSHQSVLPPGQYGQAGQVMSQYSQIAPTGGLLGQPTGGQLGPPTIGQHVPPTSGQQVPPSVGPSVGQYGPAAGGHLGPPGGTQPGPPGGAQLGPPVGGQLRPLTSGQMHSDQMMPQPSMLPPQTDQFGSKLPDSTSTSQTVYQTNQMMTQPPNNMQQFNYMPPKVNSMPGPPMQNQPFYGAVPPRSGNISSGPVPPTPEQLSHPTSGSGAPYSGSVNHPYNVQTQAKNAQYIQPRGPMYPSGGMMAAQPGYPPNSYPTTNNPYQQPQQQARRLDPDQMPSPVNINIFLF